MKQHFRMFAAYNSWANARLYEAAGALRADEFERDTGAVFKSMCGTLNHILVADRIWMKRFTGEGQAP
ncbi:MAG: DinB family protein, partial [Mesorhizobium sp.]|nr:DinB family protein [Mesorhizobium sp.]